MIHIPTEEIKQPSLHADTLGFTFVWKGHFLRGIYPQSVELAKSYFDTGFIDVLVDKRLFPKTWVSEFENEQFGMIIEHEMISPVLYATEWNSAMLQDAALMVLDIAKIAWKHGYNMADCHKLNVMFRNNRPIYVDLGSFIPKEKGSTGWNPYSSFLRSYYYILKMWASGAPLIAKRMMAPGLEMPYMDYYAFKSPIYQLFPSLVRYKNLIQEGMCRIAVWGNEEVSKRGRIVKLMKPIVNLSRPSISQRIGSLKRKVNNIKIRNSAKPLPIEENKRIEALAVILNTRFSDAKTAIFIDSRKSGYYEILHKKSNIERIISIQQDDTISNREYKHSNPNNIFSSASFRLTNNTILIRNKFPEDRFRSELTIIPQFSPQNGVFGLHNSVVFVEKCFMYSKSAIILGVDSEMQELVDKLSKSHCVEYVSNGNSDLGGYYIITQNT